MKKKRWVLSALKMALQAMCCRPARAWIVRHLRLSFGKRGVWAGIINAKRIVVMLWFKLIRELGWVTLVRQPPGA